jgi:hypothetical protein
MNQIESIFWGIISGLSAVFLEFVIFATFTLFSNPTDEISMAKFFTIPAFVITSAFIEELCKYTIIATRIDMISLKWSYILNSFLVGFGFFAIELIIILLFGVFPPYSLIAELAIVHSGTAALMGYVMSFRNPTKPLTFLLAIFPALVFHASYNILSLSRNLVTNYIIGALLVSLIGILFIAIFRTSSRLAQE